MRLIFIKPRAARSGNEGASMNALENTLQRIFRGGGGIFHVGLNRGVAGGALLIQRVSLVKQRCGSSG